MEEETRMAQLRDLVQDLLQDQEQDRQPDQALALQQDREITE